MASKLWLLGVSSCLGMHWRLPENLRGTPFEQRLTQSSGDMDTAFVVDRPKMENGVLQDLQLANSLSFVVPLDHFNKSNPINMTLRYWIVDSAWNGSSEAPLIFYMPDEASGGSPENRAASLAREFGGVEVHTEHRFFGETLPPGGLKESNLKFLTVEQNLADVEALTRHVQKKLNLTGPVVATGCSYAGASASWLRAAYPDTIGASISGSGPVQAKLDFFEYDQSISTTLAAISPDCQDSMAKTMLAFSEVWDEGNSSRDALKRSFLMGDTVGTPLGDVDFLYMLADSVAYSVQYGDKRAVCDALAQLSPDASTQERTSGWAHFVLASYGTTWAVSEWYDSEWMRDSQRAGSGRAWYWMTCTQLGYLQSVPHSEPPPRMRSRDLKSDLLQQQCAYIFPKSTAGVEATIDKFNQRFGGASPDAVNTSRVIYLRYEDDPWAPLQPSASRGEELPVFLAGNDADADPSRSCAHCGAGCSVPALQQLNSQTADTLGKWFGVGRAPRPAQQAQAEWPPVQAEHQLPAAGKPKHAAVLADTGTGGVLLPSHGHIEPHRR